MQFTSNGFLKISAGVALLLGGGAVANYYMVTLPHQADVIAQQQAAAQQAATEAKAAIARKEDAEAERKRNTYRVCVSSASADYMANWNTSCGLKSHAAETGFKNCMASGYSTAAQCREAFPAIPETNCTLPTLYADNLNSQLHGDKDACMKEAESGIAG